MPPRISPVGSNQSALSPSAILGLPPISATTATELAGVNTFPAVGRIVLGQTDSAGGSGKYVRIRASASGAILATATVGDGATSLTVINRGLDAETYAVEIEAWLELVVTAATVSMLSSATINDIGATNTANVFARFATPTSAAEAVTQRAYVFETDDAHLTFYEATPQTVYGAGTASCNGELTFYDVDSGYPRFVYSGSTDPTIDGILWDAGEWLNKLSGTVQYSITSAAASPSLATGTWTVTNGTAPAPTVLGVTYDVEVASRVQWPIQSAVLLADFEKTNDMLTAVTGWSNDIVLEAGHWYRVTAQLTIACDTVGFNATFNGGSVTATGLAGGVFGYQSANTAFLSQVLASLSDPFSVPTDGGIVVFVDFSIQVNAGGTLNLQFAQSSTNAAATVLNKYSIIQAIDVTP